MDRQLRNVHRVPVETEITAEWQDFRLQPASAVGDAFPHGDNQALFAVELIFLSRDGESIQMNLGDIRMKTPGLIDLDIFRHQEQVLDQQHSPSNIHNAGYEIVGLRKHASWAIHSQDHLLGLFPNGIPRLFDFYDQNGLKKIHPESGVNINRSDGGLPALSHILSSSEYRDLPDEALANQIAERVVEKSAFDVEAMEVAFPFRERPPKDYIEVWDRHFQNGHFLPEIATSENHDVKAWELCEIARVPGYGADTKQAHDLIAGFQSGCVIFADPL